LATASFFPTSSFPVRAASRFHDRVQPQKESPTTSSLLTAERAEALALHRPKLILQIGSGVAGKSFWSRWFIERAAKRGAPLDICDADPLSPALPPLAHDADGSDYAPGRRLDHQDWLERKIAASAESRRSLILDPGPMLFGLIEWFKGVPFALAVEELGLDFVMVYLLAPDPDNLPRLPYLLGLIKVPRTVIVLNEWRMSADDGATAFADIITDLRVAAARADGAHIVTMPHLPPPNRLDALRAHNPRHHNPARSEWLDRMEDNFAPVAAWSTDMRQARLSSRKAGFFSLTVSRRAPIHPAGRSRAALPFPSAPQVDSTSTDRSPPSSPGGSRSPPSATLPLWQPRR
jgi:hypothetical protein